MSDRTCSVEDCDGPVHGHGLCNKHRQRWRTHGDLELRPRRNRSRDELCEIENCTKPYLSKGLCGTHYAQETLRGTSREDMNAGRMVNERVTFRPRYECAVTGCPRDAESKGLCRSHHAQQLRGYQQEDMIPFPPPGYERGCAVPGCDRKHYGKGLCQLHHSYARLYDMTPEEMARAQATELCEACGLVPPEVVDHCHKTKRFRGALCHRCNVAEGLLGGDPRAAQGLVNYMLRVNAALTCAST